MAVWGKNIPDSTGEVLAEAMLPGWVQPHQLHCQQLPSGSRIKHLPSQELHPRCTLHQEDKQFLGFMPEQDAGYWPVPQQQSRQKNWGNVGLDPVHPSEEAYRAIATVIEEDTLCADARYTNSPNTLAGHILKKPYVVLAKSRQEYVDGCSATLPRCDTVLGGEQGNVAPVLGRGRGRSKPVYCSFRWKKYGRSRGGPRWGK